MDQSDDDLPALLATDLDRYFEQLVLTYQHRLYAFVLRWKGSSQDAEEVVQDALERAYHALADYPPQRIRTLRLQPWLYTITQNVLLNRSRAFKPQSVSLDRSKDNPLLEIEDQSLSPDEEIHRRERRNELEIHVAMLPDIYREAVRLYYFEELSYREVAEQLHQPIGTVKANVYRGTRLLRKLLEAPMNEVR